MLRWLTHMKKCFRVVPVIAFLAWGSASAQILLDGEWAARYHEDQPERIPGPELGDYLGLPINDAARLRAESWNSSRLTLQEHQCRVHISPYIYRGPLELRVPSNKLAPSGWTAALIRPPMLVFGIGPGWSNPARKGH